MAPIVHRWLRLVLVLVLCLVSVHASAEPAERVVLQLAAPEAEQESARASLEEGLHQSGVELELALRPTINVAEVVTRRPETEPPLARIWVDLTTDNQLAVYVADRAWERILIRLVPRSDNPAVAHEQVAQIVAAAVHALRDGARIGIERSVAHEHLLPPQTKAEPRRPPRPVPLPSAPPPRFPDLWLGAGYELVHQSQKVPVIHAGSLQLGVMLAPLGGADLGLELAASLRPARYASPQIGARLNTLAVRWLGVISSPRHHTLRLRAEIGGGVDAVQLEPRREAGGLEPSSKRGLLFGALRGAVGVELDIVRLSRSGAQKLALAPLLLADVELTDTRYVVNSPAGESVAFDPFLVQPAFALLLVLR